MKRRTRRVTESPTRNPQADQIPFESPQSFVRDDIQMIDTPAPPRLPAQESLLPHDSPQTSFQPSESIAEHALHASTTDPTEQSTSVDSDSVMRFMVITDNHVGYLDADPLRGKDALISFEECMQLAQVNDVDFILHGGDLFDIARPNIEMIDSVMKIFNKYTQRLSSSGDRVSNDNTCMKVLNPQSDGTGNQSRPSSSASASVTSGSVDTSDHFANHTNTNHASSKSRIPVFMIHGNHDEPTGPNQVSVGDILQSAGLIKYFGKQTHVAFSPDQQGIVVSPLILQKGQTNIALYGLGNLKDERLHRAFLNNAVTFMVPNDPTQPRNPTLNPSSTASTYFNLMTIHQNRYRGTAGGGPVSKACIHEHMLPSFFDLAVWGHEHESKPFPEEFIQAGFHVLQPGSSVNTSLTITEAKQKHIVLIEVCGKQFRCTPIPLLSVRPVLIANADSANRACSAQGEIDVPKFEPPHPNSIVRQNLTLRALAQPQQNKITNPWPVASGPDKEIIQQVISLSEAGRKLAESNLVARNDWLKSMNIESLFKHDPAIFTRPLIRLKVPQQIAQVAGLERTTNQKFGLQFTQLVANPESILQVVSAAKRQNRAPLLGITVEDSTMYPPEPEEEEDGMLSMFTASSSFQPNNQQSLQDLVFNAFATTDGKDMLQLFPEPDLNQVIQEFVAGQESTAIEKYIKSTTDAALVDARKEIHLGRMTQENNTQSNAIDENMIRAAPQRQSPRQRLSPRGRDIVLQPMTSFDPKAVSKQVKEYLIARTDQIRKSRFSDIPINSQQHATGIVVVQGANESASTAAKDDEDDIWGNRVDIANLKADDSKDWMDDGDVARSSPDKNSRGRKAPVLPSKRPGPIITGPQSKRRSNVVNVEDDNDDDDYEVVEVAAPKAKAKAGRRAWPAMNR